jgi:hypothetical protein
MEKENDKQEAVGNVSELSDLLCTWKKISEEKPKQNQICIVAANIGDCAEAQCVAVKWVKHKFVWAVDIGLGDFPSEFTTHWMPWPSDPVT